MIDLAGADKHLEVKCEIIICSAINAVLIATEWSPLLRLSPLLRIWVLFGELSVVVPVKPVAPSPVPSAADYFSTSNTKRDTNTWYS